MTHLARPGACVVAVSLLLMIGAAEPAAARLPSDCNDDGRVVVSELIVAVNIALGSATTSACAAADLNGDGAVAVNELIAAVNAALGFAPPTATPRDSPSPTAHDTTALTTATPSPTPRCATTPLPSDSQVVVDGSTADGADTAGGASCGFGGGAGAPDTVYEYVAPAAGMYDIATSRATFPVYLFVRENGCAPSNAELACQDSPGDAAVAVALAAGERVAIVVDGTVPTGGSFTLNVARRQADLVVRALSVPPAAAAGAQIEVEAEVENTGTAPTGPFSVEFFWARDASLNDRLGLGVTRCAIGAGLQPGARAACRPLNQLTVPLVAAAGYVVGARVDDTNAVDESNEENNSAAAASVMTVAGVQLQHALYRARDGTAYQLVAAVPSTLPTAADRYRITTLAALSGTAVGCSTLATEPGSLARAVAGATTMPLLDGALRTAILRSNDAAQVSFDPVAGGRLVLGSGATASAVCARPGRCPADGLELVPMTSAGDGIPGGCAASNVPGAICNDQPVASTIGFSGQAGGGCGGSADITAETEICAVEPSDGFVLRPGEAVVFVYAPGRDLLEAAVGGFGLSGPLGAAGCTGNRIVEPRALVARSQAQPLLSVAGTVGDIDPQAFASIAVSPDRRHVYAVSRDVQSLAVFRAGADAGLELIEQQRQGQHGVDGLDDAAAVAVSPDGAHVYVAGSGTVAIFRRDADSGRLAFVNMRRNGVGGVDGIDDSTSLMISPDGAHVYVGSLSALAVFRRDPTTGALTFVEAQRNGIEGKLLCPAVLSPDGAHLYTASLDQAAIVVFSRDAESGRLTFVAAQRDGDPGVSGLTAPCRLAISPDGMHLYAASPGTTPGVTLVALRRDPATGLLTTIGSVDASDTLGLTITGVFAVAVSPDGTSVYIGGVATDSEHGGGVLASFRRDATTGALQAQQADFAGFATFEAPMALAITSDGTIVYAATAAYQIDTPGVPSTGAIVVYQRHPSDGIVEPAGEYRGAPPPFNGLLLSRDGSEAYRVAVLRGSAVLRRFRRDAATGQLETVQELPLAGSGLSDDLSLEQTSPDDAALYATDTIAAQIGVFRRQAGELVLQQVLPVDDLGTPGPLAVSSDGRHVYVGFCQINPGIAILLRAADGSLSMKDSIRQTDPGFAGLGCPNQLALSADGRQLYATSGAVPLVVLDRDPDSGGLAFSAGHQDIAFPTAFGLSPDGRHLYVATPQGIALYRRDLATGALTYGGLQPRELGQVRSTLIVSPDGGLVYLADRSYDGTDFFPALSADRRDSATGTLTPAQSLSAVFGLQLSPDGAFVYTTQLSNGLTLILAVAD